MKAYYLHDYTALVGVYFVALWNVSTGTFEVDGLERVEYKHETGILDVQLARTGVFAVCAAR